ncbi:MAG: hypothetical protein IKL84_00630, partial [Clostridia bacterium]|nr:hypothetical protein [Clostridia bacterium]
MMKKYVYSLMCILLLICVMLTTACKPLDADEGGARDGDESVKTYNDTVWLDEIHDLGEVKTWDYSVQYVRAGVKAEPVRYPAVRIIRSVDEMKRYLAEEANVSDALTEACRKYDADYFKAQWLMIVLLEEGSGSIRHEVERLGTDGMRTFVEIKTIVPEEGTCDMAYWHILIEPEAGVYPDDEREVVVFLDGRNATDRPNTVTYGRGNASIAVTLKDGWAYDITDSADENEFSINIYPAGQSENKLRIAYYNGFGVCGTGLKQEQIMLGQYEAWMGTYDDNPVWNFITLRGLPG